MKMDTDTENFPLILSAYWFIILHIESNLLLGLVYVHCSTLNRVLALFYFFLLTISIVRIVIKKLVSRMIVLLIKSWLARL